MEDVPYLECDSCAIQNTPILANDGVYWCSCCMQPLCVEDELVTKENWRRIQKEFDGAI